MRKRNKDLHEDKGGLYGNPDAVPRSKGGKGTWDGHRQQHFQVYIRLCKALKKYLESCDNNNPPGAKQLIIDLESSRETDGPDVPDRVRNLQHIHPSPNVVCISIHPEMTNQNYILPVAAGLVVAGMVVAAVVFSNGIAAPLLFVL